MNYSLGSELNLSVDAVRHAIADSGRAAAEAKQVALRLKRLLPKRLAYLQANYSLEFPSMVAKRKALTDPEYLGFLKEIQDALSLAFDARLRFESLNMLVSARQSLRSCPPELRRLF